MAMRLILAACLSALVAVTPASAQDVPVDLELVLAVDVSRSMTRRELEIQRRGYAAAIASDAVVQAIMDGPNGQVAIMYMEWAGTYSQQVVVDWTLVRDAAGAAAFADRLSTRFDSSLRRTSISGAIARAAESFEGNGYRGLRRVIDISGDGPNNQGPPVAPARDSALGRGIVINGLPLMTREGLGSQWHLEDLDRYYRDCVIGGPGAFIVPVLDWDDFPGAVRRKLLLELVGPAAPDAIPAQFTLDAMRTYDCLIGEKIWRNMMDDRF